VASNAHYLLINKRQGFLINFNFLKLKMEFEVRWAARLTAVAQKTTE